MAICRYFHFFLIILFSFIFLLLTDFTRIFILRSEVKKAANSAALAAGQDILYLRPEGVSRTAEQAALANGCDFENIIISYDEVTVEISKKINFLLISKIGPDSIRVYASSKVKVIFPWDEKFDSCERIRFDFSN